MNTNDEKIQWHPAFDAALQIEFGEEAEYLEFDSEHLLSKKPMQIDVYAYACIYKADTEKIDLIPAAELTITFVCYHYPRNMLRKLEQDRKFSVEQQDSGIYYLIGDAIPIQLVIVPKLSKEHNYWLNNLRNDLKAGSEIKKITESGLKSIDNTTITHSCVGDFTYNPKTGAVSKMKGGGHGQANIEFLEANGLEYNIVKVYDNGVRIGVIRTNGRISTIFPDAASQP